MTPKARDKYLIKKYGISLKQYNTKLRLQNNSCDLCARHKSEFSRNLCVDHNHSTKRVRGLLCFTCNKIRVGKLNLEWAEKVFNYLKRHDG